MSLLPSDHPSLPAYLDLLNTRLNAGQIDMQTALTYLGANYDVRTDIARPNTHLQWNGKEFTVAIR